MDEWIEKAVGKMHTHKITQIMISKKLGVTNDYISMILRGIKTPAGAKERILGAIDEIILSSNMSDKAD